MDLKQLADRAKGMFGKHAGSQSMGASGQEAGDGYSNQSSGSPSAQTTQSQGVGQESADPTAPETQQDPGQAGADPMQ